jgi:nucleotide-binding universal stress UspA family protein
MTELLYCAPGHIFCRAKKILLAVDGSEASARAATAAFEIAEMTKSKLLILHVIPIPIVKQIALMSDIDMEEMLVKYATKGETLLEGVKASAADYNLDIQLILDRGSPSDRIISQAETNEVDLVVLGKQGISTSGRAGIGSSSERVLLRIECPVLVVK